MKSLFKKKYPTINGSQLHPGDIFIVHDTVGHNKIRLAQKLTGNIQYSNFVHGGIISLDAKAIIHSTGTDGLQSSSIYSYFDFDKLEDYRIFRLKNNYLHLAQKIAEVADMMYNHTNIPYSLVGTSKMSNFNMLRKTMLFKNKKPPKDESELEKEMDGFLRKDPQFTTFCTKFITFVIQYACLKLNLDSTQIIGKIRDTKAIPARLIELLKKSSSFTEFKNCEDDYDEVSIHNLQTIHPTGEPSPTLAWSPRAAPPPPIARIVPSRPAPPPPINNLEPSPLQRQGARRWPNPPIFGPSPLQRQGARRWPNPPTRQP